MASIALSVNVLAQSEHPQLFVGIDPLKTLVHPIFGGYHFSPEIKYRFARNFAISFESTWVKAHEVLEDKNIANYSAEGSSQKIGAYWILVRKGSSVLVSFGLKGMYSQFQERGTFEIPGPYFGSYREDFEREKLRTFATELEVALLAEMFPRCWIRAGLNFARTTDILFLKEEYPRGIENMGIRYVPGLGRSAIPTTNDYIEGFSLSCKVFYEF